VRKGRRFRWLRYRVLECDVRQNWAVCCCFLFLEVGLGEARARGGLGTGWGKGGKGVRGVFVFLGDVWVFGCLDGLRHLVLRCATRFVFGWRFCSVEWCWPDICLDF